jgi:hypothetical protein
MVAGRLKLIREWYKRPEYDLTIRFQGDPQMHMINAILDKCLHESPDKCLPNAEDLLLVVDAHLRVMRRGGQMLRDGVPRPCRICGQGFYQVPGGTTQALGLPIMFGVPGGSGSWRHEGALYARFLTCDYCGNVELFKT